MLETHIQVQINQFDGPLALLLHLVQKEEMPIADLDVSKITQQYLDYLRKMQQLNFDVAGEYLYMAASLLHIKSRHCLDDENEDAKVDAEFLDQNLEITSRSQLIQKLEELEYYQRLGERLWQLPKRNEQIFVKPKVDRKAIVNSILTPIDLEQLTKAMVELIRREKRQFAVIRRDRLSIKEKLKTLRQTLKQGQRADFFELTSFELGVEDVVITFISLLELARLSKISLFQNEQSKHIYIDVLQSLQDFDVDEADGFESDEDSDQKSQQTEPREDEKVSVLMQ